VLNGGKAASYHLLRAIEKEIKALHDKLAKTEQYKEWVKCRVKKEQVKNKLIREQDVQFSLANISNRMCLI
jgi:phage shock protein A